MIPVKVLRPALLSSVEAPGALLPTSKHEALFLVGTMADGGKAACFITGDHAGNGFLCDEPSTWTGLAVEGLEFEVDLESAYDPGSLNAIAGSIIRKDDRLETITRMKHPDGFSHYQRVILAAGLPIADGERETGFTRWRAVTYDGDEAIKILDLDVTPKA